MHKSSKQRDAIYELLKKKNYHPSVDELYALAKKNFPSISLATVYRNLDQLSEMGKIFKLEIPNQPARYDHNTENHYHIQCRGCGCIEDVWLDFDIDDHIDLNRAIPDFDRIEWDVSFSGICRKCRKKR